jgi:hypothetical protein
MWLQAAKFFHSYHYSFYKSDAKVLIIFNTDKDSCIFFIHLRHGRKQSGSMPAIAEMLPDG